METWWDDIGPDSDGLLTALEIAATDLRGVRIAILTACHSGEGQQTSGEAAVGLRAGLSIAGVPASVAALWAVPTDASTKFTMDLLTRIAQPGENDTRPGVQGDDLTRFRSAQRELLERVRRPRSSASDPLARGNSHPFWWAGFVFQGRPAGNP